MKIKQLKKKIHENEERLERLIVDAQRIWEDTGLDSKDPSYLIEKTMRFELAQKSIMTIFSAFKDVIEDYKKLCAELEKSEQ